jgi:hypothetical protein
MNAKDLRSNNRRPAPGALPLTLHSLRFIESRIRYRQDVAWNRQADLLDGFNIDHESTLHGQNHWLGTKVAVCEFFAECSCVPIEPPKCRRQSYNRLEPVLVTWL